MEVVFDVGNADRDAQEVFELTNKAYKCEIGDTGIAFKDEDRLTNPLDSGMDESYANGQVLIARRTEDQKLAGIIRWSLEKSSEEMEGEDCCRFGPLAVDPDFQKLGLGGRLIDEVEKIALQKGCKFLEIFKANWRTDLDPWYEKKGFKVVGQTQFPPERRTTRPSFEYIMRKAI